MYHRWRSLPSVHQEHMDWKFRHITSHHEQLYQSLQSHQNSWVDSRKLKQYACHQRRKALHQCPTHWQYWMGPHSMAHEVLPQGRCKSVFPNMQLLQGNKITNDYYNNIAVESTASDIALDCHIKTCNSWINGVKFLQETSQERAQSATTHKKILLTYILNQVTLLTWLPMP